MSMRPACNRISVAVLILGLTAAAVGCSKNASPVSPSPLSGAGTTAVSAAAAAHPTPAELTSRGWSCFTPPVVPARIVCSHPNQGFPTVGNPPPDDRPATFTLWLFDGSGVFTGTELLIRTDLYRGQICESTGQPYFFAALIGYYECVHTPGR